ncbi:MAG: hypothetical protein AzoDbin1_03924 [Azoarcus sp.]|nr:hypothetical protein [Aromatoleum toluolicum]MCK9987452.1 hypothetical protein [Azoarcus sp.]NMF98493.2 hypothetical protein [Aromatoleum toluolicum]
MKPVMVMRVVFALAAAAAMSVTFAAAPTDEEHQSHHPDVAQVTPATTGPAASMPALQQRMKAIRTEKDPARRMALMEEQMTAMESAMRDMPEECPMAGGTMGGKAPDMMRDHMRMMEKRMDMMQQMMEMHMKAGPTNPMK